MFIVNKKDGTQVNVENVLYKANPSANPLQLDKLVVEGTLVWENWRETNKGMSLGDAKQGETMYATLTDLNGLFKPTKVNWRYAWAGEGSHPADIKITIWDEKNRTHVLLDEGGYHKDRDYSFNIPTKWQIPIKKIEIQAYLGGTVGVSKWFVSASCDGFVKPNIKPSEWAYKSGSYGYPSEDKMIKSGYLYLPSFKGVRKDFIGEGQLLLGKDQGWNWVDLIMEGIPENGSSWVKVGTIASCPSNPTYGVHNPFGFHIGNEKGYTKLRLKISPTTWGVNLRNFKITGWYEKGGN